MAADEPAVIARLEVRYTPTSFEGAGSVEITPKASGQAQKVQAVTRHLARRGHHVTVLTARRGETTGLPNGGVEVACLPLHPTHFPGGPMKLRTLSSIVAVVLAQSLPTALAAQHGGGGQLVPTIPREATQFDFLVGQWELVVKPIMNTLAARIHGTPVLAGTWKGWRALEGFGIEDDLRIVDGSLNPRSFTHSVRYYDTSAHQWKVSTLDVYRGKVRAVRLGIGQLWM